MLRFFSLRDRLLRTVLARRGTTILRAMGPQALGDLALIRQTHDLVPTLVQDAAALHLLACVRACRRLGGAMAEAGVFAGGTARLICEAKGDAPLRLFDVFETLQGAPLPDEKAGAAAEVRAHFGRTHGRRADVERLLAPYGGVHVHAGVFPDSARGLEAERFAFVHLDLDLATSTRDALEFFHPQLLPGGIILGDDYQYAGVRRVFEDYVAGRPDTLVALPWGQGMVVKVRSA